MISIKLLSKFIEITLWHACSPVNALHVFRTPFPENTFGRLHLDLVIVVSATLSKVETLKYPPFHGIPFFGKIFSFFNLVSNLFSN